MLSYRTLFSDLVLLTLGSEASLMASRQSSSALTAFMCLSKVNVSFRLSVLTLNSSGEEAKKMLLGHLRIVSMS